MTEISRDNISDIIITSALFDILMVQKYHLKTVNLVSPLLASVRERRLIKSIEISHFVAYYWIS